MAARLAVDVVWCRSWHVALTARASGLGGQMLLPWMAKNSGWQKRARSRTVAPNGCCGATYARDCRDLDHLPPATGTNIEAVTREQFVAGAVVAWLRRGSKPGYTWSLVKPG